MRDIESESVNGSGGKVQVNDDHVSDTLHTEAKDGEYASAGLHGEIDDHGKIFEEACELKRDGNDGVHENLMSGNNHTQGDDSGSTEADAVASKSDPDGVDRVGNEAVRDAVENEEKSQARQAVRSIKGRDYGDPDDSHWARLEPSFRPKDFSGSELVVDGRSAITSKQAPPSTNVVGGNRVSDATKTGGDGVSNRPGVKVKRPPPQGRKKRSTFFFDSESGCDSTPNGAAAVISSMSNDNGERTEPNNEELTSVEAQRSERGPSSSPTNPQTSRERGALSRGRMNRSVVSFVDTDSYAEEETLATRSSSTQSQRQLRSESAASTVVPVYTPHFPPSHCYYIGKVRFPHATQDDDNEKYITIPLEFSEHTSHGLPVPLTSVCEGDGLSFCVVNTPATFRVHLKDKYGIGTIVPKGTVVVNIVKAASGDSKKESRSEDRNRGNKCSYRCAMEGSFVEVTYQCGTDGFHELEVLVLGQHVPGSPFSLWCVESHHLEEAYVVRQMTKMEKNYDRHYMQPLKESFETTNSTEEVIVKRASNQIFAKTRAGKAGKLFPRTYSQLRRQRKKEKASNSQPRAPKPKPPPKRSPNDIDWSLPPQELLDWRVGRHRSRKNVSQDETPPPVGVRPNAAPTSPTKMEELYSRFGAPYPVNPSRKMARAHRSPRDSARWKQGTYVSQVHQSQFDFETPISPDKSALSSSISPRHPGAGVNQTDSYSSQALGFLRGRLESLSRSSEHPAGQTQVQQRPNTSGGDGRDKPSRGLDFEVDDASQRPRTSGGGGRSVENFGFDVAGSDPMGDESQLAILNVTSPPKYGQRSPNGRKPPGTPRQRRLIQQQQEQQEQHHRQHQTSTRVNNRQSQEKEALPFQFIDSLDVERKSGDFRFPHHPSHVSHPMPSLRLSAAAGGVNVERFYRNYYHNSLMTAHDQVSDEEFEDEKVVAAFERMRLQGFGPPDDRSAGFGVTYLPEFRQPSELKGKHRFFSAVKGTVATKDNAGNQSFR